MPTDAGAVAGQVADPEPESAPSVPANPADFAEISYEEFGARFFREAVTVERISEAISGMANRGLEFSIAIPGVAGVHASGKIGEPSVTQLASDDVQFSVTVPAGLLLDLKLPLTKVKLEASVEIDLMMTARAAAPLSMVVDIPAITDDNVRIVFRAEALGAMWQWIIEPMGDAIRREIAARINAMLHEPASVASRIFDIKARMDERESRPSLDFEWITYQQFGIAFFQNAVSTKRIREGVADLNGRQVQIGPMKTGPKDMAEVVATGVVEQPQVVAVRSDSVEYNVLIPVQIDLTVALRRDNRYRTRIDIPLRIRARALDPLQVFVDVTPPAPDEIHIDLKSKGMGAAILGLIGGIKGQIAEQVAATVAEETTDTSNRLIDVSERIHSA